MPSRAEVLFEKLKRKKNIIGLIGSPEDSDFDCKEWGQRLDGMRGSIAKAACGFANATGGVIVIGMKASGTGANLPDIVKEEKPVSDVNAVSSEVLDIILKQVEPGIEGVQIHRVRVKPKSKAGYVLVHVPEADGSPRRSKVDGKFYVRIASGTLPMEYFQIEDRFGRRPHARLVAEVKHDNLRNMVFQPDTVRTLAVTLTNEGRGLARFPAVRIRRTKDISIDGYPNSMTGKPPIWLVSDADLNWFSFRGSANDVIYPGESLRIASLVQAGHRIDRISPSKFPGIVITTEAVCDGMPAHQQSFSIHAAGMEV